MEPKTEWDFIFSLKCKEYKDGMDCKINYRDINGLIRNQTVFVHQIYMHPEYNIKYSFGELDLDLRNKFKFEILFGANSLPKCELFNKGENSILFCLEDDIGHFKNKETLAQIRQKLVEKHSGGHD